MSMYGHINVHCPEFKLPCTFCNESLPRKCLETTHRCLDVFGKENFAIKPEMIVDRKRLNITLLCGICKNVLRFAY